MIAPKRIYKIPTQEHNLHRWPPVNGALTGRQGWVLVYVDAWTLHEVLFDADRMRVTMG